MRINSTLFHSPYLQVAWGEWNYPYIYPGQKQGEIMGYLYDIFRIFSDNVTLRRYPYESSLSSCNGVLLGVQQGEVLTSIDGSTPTAARIPLFRLSHTAFWTSYEMLESARSSDEEETELVFFTVFSLPSLALLIFLHYSASLIYCLTALLQRTNEKKAVPSTGKTPLLPFFSSLSTIIYTIGITLVVFYHSAGFKGNTVIHVDGKATSFDDALIGLHSGKRLLMTLAANTLKENEIFILIGNRSRTVDIYEPDMVALMQRMCDDPSIITVIRSHAKNAMPLTERPCRLRRITVSRPIVGLEKLSGTISQNYMTSRNYTTRKTTEDINQVLLRLYPQDMIETFWTRRYLKTLKNQTEPDPSLNFIPVRLKRLMFLLYFIGPGLLISATFCLMEYLSRYNPFLQRVFDAVHSM